MFLEYEGFDNSISIERIALNMAQVRQYNPPPNPAKITDSRYGAYVSEYGGKSWELDALDPRVLDKLIGSSIIEFIDMEQYKDREALEQRERDRLLDVARNWENGKTAQKIVCKHMAVTGVCCWGESERCDRQCNPKNCEYYEADADDETEDDE